MRYIKKHPILENTQSSTQSGHGGGGPAYINKGNIGGMGAIRSAIVEDWSAFNEEVILEDGDGGGGAPAGGGNAGSGDVSGGAAYINQGNVDGMGAVKNATVSVIPGDPDGSEPGSGDVSVRLPAGMITKTAGGKNPGGITGNQLWKQGNIKIGRKFLQDAKKVKDKLGIGKAMSFQEFSTKQL